MVKSVSQTTKHGTVFPSSTVQKYKNIGYSKKTLGLGVGAAFIGGAAIGYGSSVASYSILHRYQEYRRLKWQIHKEREWFWDEDEDWDEDYYENYYRSNACLYGCPPSTQCQWGFCDCKEGYVRAYGRCWINVPKLPSKRFDLKRLEIDPVKRPITCIKAIDCTKVDMNLVCFTLSNQSDFGVCKCRRDMEWNPKSLECQMKLKVNCSQFNHTSPVSPVVTSAIEDLEKRVESRKKREKIEFEKNNKERCIKEGCDKALLGKPMVFDGKEMAFALLKNIDLQKCWQRNCQMLPSCREREGLEIWFQGISGPVKPNSCDSMAYFYKTLGENQYQPHKKEDPETNRTQTPEESLEESLLSQDIVGYKSITEKDLDELFCREIDAFSEAFQAEEVGRPEHCREVPPSVCAVLYDSASCGGGWTLNITDGSQKKLHYFSSDWKYRNDADLLAVAAGCTFTGFSGVDFDGEKLVIGATETNRWVSFSASASTRFMDENILSYTCVCRG